jgi:addiction module HigA family antidote
MSNKKSAPVHPGEVLPEEFLRPMGLSQSRLALSIGVHPRRVNEIVLGKRGITAGTVLRLAKFFGTSAKFWLGLQMDYDLDIASDALGSRLDHEVRLPTSAAWDAGPHDLVRNLRNITGA